MAALMRKGRPFINHKFLRTYARERRVRDGGFYVLLPEVPPDTAETNPLLRPDSYPQFSQINPDKIVTGCAKAAIEYEVEVDKHVTGLQESDVERSFDNVIAPVDRLNSQITFPYLTAKHLSYIKGGDFNKAFERAHTQMFSARNGKWLTPAFYDLVKEVKSRKDTLTDSQGRLVDTFLFEAKMAGLDISQDEEKRLLRSIRRLTQFKHEFRERVTACDNIFSQTITDFDVISEMPKSVAKLMVEEGCSPLHGPWKVTLNSRVYYPFMEYCKDRTMRWSVYDAFINRASRRFISQNVDNHMRIGDIRAQRTAIAKSHGYETFADMTIAHKMAANVDNVLNLLEYYKTHFKPLAAEDLASVQEYAHSQGFQAKLEAWDLSYWRRKHLEHVYPLYNKDAMMEYFPFQQVLSRLFDLTSQLFGVTIEDYSTTVDVWDKNVSCYRVFDTHSREHLGSFYVDPFQRPNKTPFTWADSSRERNAALGLTPLMYINLQLPLPLLPDQPVLMNEGSLIQLTQLFGYTLRHILDTCPYSELNMTSNMEYDTHFIVPKLFYKLFLSKPLLRRLTCHVDTGKAMPEELVDMMVRGRHHLSNYDIIEKLYDSAFDMELNLNDDYFMDIKKKVWEEFLPLPHSDEDESPCSLNSVFTESSAGLIYSGVWSDMVASDLYKVFSDAGLEDLDKLTTVGLRFRENYLSYGNGLSGNETFRRFTGRDPALESMAEYYAQHS